MRVARIGDIGFGRCCHPSHRGCIPMMGIIINGSGNVVTTGKPTARVGDTVRGFCGHTGTLVTGSFSILDNGKPQARVSSAFVGVFSGNIILGSPNVDAGV